MFRNSELTAHIETQCKVSRQTRKVQFHIKFDLPEYGLLARPSLPGIAAVVPGNVTP